MFHVPNRNRFCLVSIGRLAVACSMVLEGVELLWAPIACVQAALVLEELPLPLRWLDCGEVNFHRWCVWSVSGTVLAGESGVGCVK